MDVYKLTFNGKHVYYGIAQDVGKRLSRHKRELLNRKHHNIIMQRLWEKYGIELSITCDILYTGLIVDEAEQKEKELIAEFENINIAKGGNGGDTFSNNQNLQDIKKKISDNHCGIYSEEWQLNQGSISDRASVVWGEYKCPKCERLIKGLANFRRYHGEKCGLPLPELVCPHCNKIGSGGGMYNKHFNKCPQRKENNE